MTKLSVNINKFATIRNARGGNNPDILKVAEDCQNFGADGITLHPRPDQRHIRFKDVYDLKPKIKTEYNIEGYPSDDFIKMVLEVKPTQVTLVPDSEFVITSNAGWDIVKHHAFLKDIILQLKAYNIRTSIFMDANSSQAEMAYKTQTDRIELYTENYASLYQIDKTKAIKPYIESSKIITESGIGINAGHDLDLENLKYFNQSIPNLLEVSIGHALVCDALYLGLHHTIQKYQQQLLRS